MLDIIWILILQELTSVEVTITNGFFFMIHICSPLLQFYGTDFFIFFKQVFLLNMSLKKSCSKSAEFIQVACISA